MQKLNVYIKLAAPESGRYASSYNILTSYGSRSEIKYHLAHCKNQHSKIVYNKNAFRHCISDLLNLSNTPINKKQTAYEVWYRLGTV